MSLILSVAKLITPDFFRQAKETKKVQVLTICISHYSELSCWALAKGGVKYEEYAYAPGQHILPALSLRLGGKNKYLSNTSRQTKVTASEASEDKTNDIDVDEKKQASNDRKARSTALPAAVFPDGTVLCDSWDIAAASGLPPIDPELKKLLDEELGPLARQGAYIHILKPANLNIFTALFTENKHWIWRLLCWLFLINYLHDYMVKLIQPKNQTTNEECKMKLVSVIRKIGVLITNKKTEFLGGDTIGIADIALASLMAPLVTPPLYCNGRFAHIFDKLENQDLDVFLEAKLWRSTVAGEYVMNLYKNHRQ
jgi:glutathione S-transferase